MVKIRNYVLQEQTIEAIDRLHVLMRVQQPGIKKGAVVDKIVEIGVRSLAEREQEGKTSDQS